MVGVAVAVAVGVAVVVVVAVGVAVGVAVAVVVAVGVGDTIMSTNEQLMQRVDELGSALDSACVEMANILAREPLSCAHWQTLAITLQFSTEALLRHGIRTQPDAAPSTVAATIAAPKVMGENYTPLLAAIADAVADLNGIDVAGLLARAAAALTEEHAARIDAQFTASRRDEELRALRAIHAELIARGSANPEPLGYVP